MSTIPSQALPSPYGIPKSSIYSPNEYLEKGTERALENRFKAFGMPSIPADFDRNFDEYKLSSPEAHEVMLALIEDLKNTSRDVAYSAVGSGAQLVWQLVAGKISIEDNGSVSGTKYDSLGLANILQSWIDQSIKRNDFKINPWGEK